jgi:hypothetical protein
VVHQFSSAQNLLDRFAHIRSRQIDYTVTRGRNVFPDDFTVRIGPGDGLVLRFMAASASPGSHAIATEQDDLSVRAANDVVHEERPENHDADDLEDAFLMQAFQQVHAHQSEFDAADRPLSGNTCAIGVTDQGSGEGSAFQFNPAAPVFLPQVLPAWAQVIQDIYHDWDIHAFAWQGEARATHFMTWFLAPGIDRLQCLYGRKVALFADFWNWREQLRRKWIDVIDPGADIEVVYVSPPPTQMEAW